MLKHAVCSLIVGLPFALTAAPAHKILFFSKSSGYEHSVVASSGGAPSFADKIFTELGEKNSWTFEFSKDGSKFSPTYLAQFDTVIFYTTGDLTTTGTDGQPAMTPAGKQALFDYVKGGKGFIGLHSATDTFHTDKDCGLDCQSDRDAFICMIGGEFSGHGDQQDGTNAVTDTQFPGLAKAGKSFTLFEEWYAFKNFNPDMHVLTVINSPAMKGDQYKRPPYPTSWARAEGKGRVYYNAMGHREDIWTNPIFQEMLVGAIQWTAGDVKVALSSNLKKVAPGAVPEAKTDK